jgi:hypothetical protein
MLKPQVACYHAVSHQHPVTVITCISTLTIQDVVEGGIHDNFAGSKPAQLSLTDQYRLPLFFLQFPIVANMCFYSIIDCLKKLSRKLRCAERLVLQQMFVHACVLRIRGLNR